MRADDEQLRLRAAAFRAVSQLCRDALGSSSAGPQPPSPGSDPSAGLEGKLVQFARTLSEPERRRLRLELAASFLKEVDRQIRMAP